jgi:tetratricopeptide (TPR) repeat protein
MPNLPDWEPIRDELAARDFGALFKYLQTCGWSQLDIATTCGVSTSHVSDIQRGRVTVKMIHLMERIVDALSIPRGMVGLGWADYEPQPEQVEDNSTLFDIAWRFTMGESVDQVLYLTQTNYDKVGWSDLKVIDQYFVAIEHLDQQYSGQYHSAVDLIFQIRRMIAAKSIEHINTTLRKMEGWANSFAGWCAVDAGRMNVALDHFNQALTIANQMSDDLGKCRALMQCAKAELHFGSPSQALKLFQLGFIPAGHIKSKVFESAFSANAAWAISKLDPTHVPRYVAMTWDSFGKINPEVEQGHVLKFLSRADLLSTTGEAFLNAGKYGQAIDDLDKCLCLRSESSTRSRTFETASLAAAYLNAGEDTLGTSNALRAVELAEDVNTNRLPVRFAGLAKAAKGDLKKLVRDTLSN